MSGAAPGALRWVLVGIVACVSGSCSPRDDAGAGKTIGLLPSGDTMGLPPGEAGITLGSDAWVNERDKGALGWGWERGVFEVAPGTGNLRTREKFGDCLLHVEFKTSSDPGVEWKHDGNSGVYIQRRYEIQILNSHGERVSDESCGAIYTFREPELDASRPAGEWQTFDIVFRAPRWMAGEKVENARVSVLHNGKLIHDDVAIPGSTGSGKPEGATEEPLRLQDHGSAVQFRNVWIKRLDLD
ncbi:MAG: 3-keto-disaccharide hydrolase [Verrucomicrobiales bacterium]